MKHIVIFEDEGRSLTVPGKSGLPVSRLLQTNPYGIEVWFSCGSSNLGSEISAHVSRLKGKYDFEILAFLDYAPDNRSLDVLYSVLLDSIDSDVSDFVHIIPVMCTEYYVLKFLEKFDYLRYQSNLVDVFKILLNKNFDRYIDLGRSLFRGMSNIPTNIENSYKLLLNSQERRCMMNNSGSCRFYSESCKDCTVVGCEFAGSGLTLLEKAVCILATFPRFHVVSKRHYNMLVRFGFNPIKTDINDLIADLLEEREGYAVLFDNRK